MSFPSERVSEQCLATCPSGGKEINRIGLALQSLKTATVLGANSKTSHASAPWLWPLDAINMTSNLPALAGLGRHNLDYLFPFWRVGAVSGVFPATAKVNLPHDVFKIDAECQNLQDIL